MFSFQSGPADVQCSGMVPDPLAETQGSQKLSVIPTPYVCFCHLTLFTLYFVFLTGVCYSSMYAHTPWSCVPWLDYSQITLLQKKAVSFSTIYIHWMFSVFLGNTCYLESTADQWEEISG